MTLHHLLNQKPERISQFNEKGQRCLYCFNIDKEHKLLCSFKLRSFKLWSVLLCVRKDKNPLIYVIPIKNLLIMIMSLQELTLVNVCFFLSIFLYYVIFFK